jgi:hypothetical protein
MTHLESWIAAIAQGIVQIEHGDAMELVQTKHHMTTGVLHCGLAIYIKKYLKAKDDCGNSNISSCNKYNLPKNPLKGTKILQDIIITL